MIIDITNNKNNYLVEDNLNIYFEQLLSCLDMIDEGYLLEKNTPGFFEGYIDNCKLLFTKYKKEVLEKYINKVKEMETKSSEIDSMINSERVKGLRYHEFEYFLMVLPTGNGYYLRFVSSDPYYIGNIIPKNIFSLNDSEIKRAYKKAKKKSIDVLSKAAAIKKSAVKGPANQVAKNIHQYIETYKKFVNRQKATIDEVESLIASMKSKSFENMSSTQVAFFKKFIKLQQRSYNHDTILLKKAAESILMTADKLEKFLEKYNK